MSLRLWALVLTASIAAMLEVIDVSITNVALAHIQANLGATLAEVGWVVTGYAMASVVMIPLSQWLGEAFGQRLRCIHVPRLHWKRPPGSLTL